ncbi:hypothetical protein JXQ31_12285 [candidate division KSB1 bacterium]|nr:hypothetical protein [candidate division KSB1 bacterium]
MKFTELLHIIENDELFESSLLFAGDVNPKEIRRQLSRWTKAGRINQLRRGLYILASPYRKREPHPFRVANLLVHGSYISLHSALSYYNMIPEFTAAVTSVTTGRPGMKETILGRFEYKHVKMQFFNYYYLTGSGSDQHFFIASPEKALFDLLYLVPGSHTMAYLQELRLHFSDKFQLDQFLEITEKSDSSKLTQAGRLIKKLFEQEKKEYESL